MTEDNPQPSTQNKTREPVCLEHWCRDRVYKIAFLARLKVAIDRRFLIRLFKLLHCEI